MLSVKVRSYYNRNEVPDMHPAFVLVERDRDEQWSCSSKTLDVSIV